MPRKSGAAQMIQSSDEEEVVPVNTTRSKPMNGKTNRPGPLSSKKQGQGNMAVPSSSKQKNSKPGPLSSKKNGETRSGEHYDDDDAETDHRGADPVVPREEVEQSDGTRREIRHNIRRLMDDLKDNQIEYSDPKSDRLTNVLEEANQIFSNVKKAREGALDSALVLSIAQIGRQKAQRLHTDFLVFNAKNFIMKATRFITSMTLEQVEAETPEVSFDDWQAFGKQHRTLFRTSPSFQFMFGAFTREPPRARVVKERRPKDKETNARTDIRQLKSLKEASSEEATTGEVDKIWRLLDELTQSEPGESREPICYFSFVINPDSFSQTVENIFYTSFLIKDGLARISLDDDKLPVIGFLDKPEDGSAGSSRNADKTQVVMPLTMKEWQELVQAYDISEPLIPTRPPYNPNNLKRKHASSS